MDHVEVAVYLAVAVAVVAWNVVVAGQAARARDGTEWFRWLNALAALLLIPAVVVAVTDGALPTARISDGIAWLWPLAIGIVAAQSIGAAVTRLVSPAIALPVVAWNVTLALVAAGRWFSDGATEPASWLATLGTAQAHALGRLIGEPALLSPLALVPPLIAPVYPIRRRGRVAAQAIVALVATVGVGAIGREFRSAATVRASYAQYAPFPLQERPGGDFAIGVRILPMLHDAPGAYALRMDFGVVDSIGARAVLVVVELRTPGSALDSLARALDPYRRDSVVVIVAIGNAPRTGRTSADDRYALRDRVAFVDEVARRLRPHYLLPEPPDGDDGGRSLETREELLARSAVVAHAVSGRIHVGLAVRPSVAADSALYAWAAPPDSPVDAIGFAIVAGFGGASTIDGQLATAARWMRTTAAGGHPVWIWSAATAPVAHGDASQTWALRGMLAWATSHAAVRGLIVSDAGDYTERSGLRSASGRLRPAVELLTRAIDDLTETRATPAPGPAPPAPTLVATPIPKR